MAEDLFYGADERDLTVSFVEEWSLCRVPAIIFERSGDLDADETLLEAQTLASEDGDIFRLDGEVSVLRDTQRIAAESVVFDKTSERMQAQGNVVFEDLSFRINSPSIEIDNIENRGQFRQPEFVMQGSHARGNAGEIVRIDEFRSLYSELVYTTCDPGDMGWHLRADEMLIDDESGRGTATHTTIYFQEVPFIYLPWFQFPIDDRRMSGLLAPTFGYSESRGGHLSLPVYWNLAANYDMTITPTWYSRHGLQIQTENRYLFETGEGQLDLSYLDDEEFGDTRWFQRWRHANDLPYDVEASLQLIDVSDGEIFDDFRDIAPEYNDDKHLLRFVDFRRQGPVWRAGLDWQNYLTLDPETSKNSRPYNRLPRLTLAADPVASESGFSTPSEFEWVTFEREDSVTGKRSHLVTALNWLVSDSWYFFEPRLQFAFTDYQLEDDPDPEIDSIDRAVPTLSIDTGLVFERFAGSQGQWLQTLEPRLYFLRTPFEDQGDIPLFDTRLKLLTYNNLFSNNRFSGADRIGDARQVTVGLATRLFDNDSGDELMHLRAGQIVYLEDRLVSLKKSTEDAPRSDFIAELDLFPNEWVSLSARVVYGEEEEEVTDRDLSVGYHDGEFAVNLGYYFEQDELEQALVSVVYPINEHWTVVAKYHESLLFDRTVENLLGFNYESCCWGFKILAGQTGDEDEDFVETDNFIHFELTLKGLSQAGRDIDSRIGESIPGYTPGF